MNFHIISNRLVNCSVHSQPCDAFSYREMRRLVFRKAELRVPVSEDEDRGQDHQYGSDRKYGYRSPPIESGEGELPCDICEVVDSEWEHHE